MAHKVSARALANFVDCMMKVTRFLLLILFLTVQLVQAQPARIFSAHKLSPVLKNNLRPLLNKQEQVFWIVTTNTDSARKLFSQYQIPVRILSEHAGNLLVVRATGTTIDSMVLPLPFVRFVDIPRQPHEELAVGS